MTILSFIMTTSEFHCYQHFVELDFIIKFLKHFYNSIFESNFLEHIK